MDWRIDQTIDVGSKRFFSDMLTRVMVHSGIKVMEELIQKYEREPDPEFTALTIPHDVAVAAYEDPVLSDQSWEQMFSWWEEWFDGGQNKKGNMDILDYEAFLRIHLTQGL